MNAMANLKKYDDVGIDSDVYTANPHKLILLLYQGAILCVATAKNHLLRGELAAKGKSISHAISIIEEGLNASLNKKVGGEIATNLSALYSYMGVRLLYANLHNDPAVLDEVSSLLQELRTAWEAIGSQVRTTAQQNPLAAVAAPPPLSAVPKGIPGYGPEASARPTSVVYGKA